MPPYFFLTMFYILFNINDFSTKVNFETMFDLSYYDLNWEKDVFKIVFLIYTTLLSALIYFSFLFSYLFEELIDNKMDKIVFKNYFYLLLYIIFVFLCSYSFYNFYVFS